MKVLLEGHRLAKTSNFGGIDSYWHQLVPRILAATQGSNDYSIAILTAFLNPKRLGALKPSRQQGAQLKHWWITPEAIERLCNWGLSIDQFGGEHDLLHIPEPYLAGRSQGRTVVTAHDLMYLHRPQFLEARWVERLDRGTRHLAHTATLWICVSEHTQNDLVRHYQVPRGRTLVVPHGVDDSFRDAAQDAAGIHRVREKLNFLKPYFLFLGSVEPKKNLPLLLEAYGMALESSSPPEADLVIAGRAAWGMSAVDEMLKRFPKLADRAHFPGFIDQEDLPCLLAGARAMILPSRYEGFGMPVLEAMAAGTPVLTTDRGALPEVAGGAALLFDADDSEGLNEHILTIDQDSNLRKSLQERGFERSRPYTWEQCAKDTLLAYRRAMELDR